MIERRLPFCRPAMLGVFQQNHPADSVVALRYTEGDIFKHDLFAGKEISVHTPPGLDWFELIEWYAFRLTLLISFLYTLWQVLKHKLKE